MAKHDYIVGFNPFYYPFKSQFLEMKCVFKHQDLKMFGIMKNMSSFQTLEVVGRGNETPLQVDEN